MLNRNMQHRKVAAPVIGPSISNIAGMVQTSLSVVSYFVRSAEMVLILFLEAKLSVYREYEAPGSIGIFLIYHWEDFLPIVNDQGLRL
jgi:hypothetical protein